MRFKNIGKTVFYAVCAVLVFLCGVMSCRLVNNMANREQKHYCLVRPLVYDAFTGEVIKDAQVVNTYDGRVYSTDGTGSTDWVSVYYGEEEELVLNTFIASAEGYKRTLIYAVCQTAGEPLNGPLIYMFAGEEGETVSMVYSPSNEYTRELAQRFEVE